MGSSLNNTDPSYRDSMETDYAPFDVCCTAIPNNGGRLNMYQTSCNTKLAMEEIPYSCRKCKGIKLSKKDKVAADTLSAERNPKTKECKTCLTLIGKGANYCAACMQSQIKPIPALTRR